MFLNLVKPNEKTIKFSKKHKNLHIAHQFKTKNGNGV
jgi:hypothetical protein